MDDTNTNKLEYSKVLVSNKKVLLSQEFQCVLVYCTYDEGGKATEKEERDLTQFGLKSLTLLDYHFDMLFKSGLYDIHILTYKGLAKSIMKYPLPKEMIGKMNIKIHVLKETDEPANGLKYMLKELTKDFIVVHGRYYVDMEIKDAIASHKISDSDMTMVLNRGITAYDSQTIYGLGVNEDQNVISNTSFHKSSIPILRQTAKVYGMYNNFEVVDDKGLSVKKSLLKHFHKRTNGSEVFKVMSNLYDSGIYIIKNWVTSLLKDTNLLIENIDYDLVKILVNNQFKKKLLKYKLEGISEIDEFLSNEFDTNSAVFINAFVKSNPLEKSLDANEIVRILESNEEEEGGDSNTSNASGDDPSDKMSFEVD